MAGRDEEVSGGWGAWNSLAVQWLRFCASTAGGMGSVPGGGTVCSTACYGAAKKKERKMSGSPDCHFAFLGISETWKPLKAICLSKQSPEPGTGLPGCPQWGGPRCVRKIEDCRRRARPTNS